MQDANQWLEDLLSIREGTPYPSILIVPKDLRKQAPVSETGKVDLMRYGSMLVGESRSKDLVEENSMLASNDLEMAGITTFQLDRGILTFQFFSHSCINEFEILAASKSSKHIESKIILQISNLEFNHPVNIDPSSVSSRNLLKGNIATASFGNDKESLDVITIWLRGLPEGWYGNKRWEYRQGAISSDEISVIENGNMVTLPSYRLGTQKLGALDLKVDGWSISLREIPYHQRNDLSVAHFCKVTKQDKTMLTGETARKFIEDDLRPFLEFLFGQNISFQKIDGRKNSHLVWIETFIIPKILPKTNGRNWFLGCLKHKHMDLTPQFQYFYRLPSDTKRQWREVIYHYISEEIMGTLGECAAAASFSFSALEGLTRSIISTYQNERDAWLREDLSLRRKKGILDAIEMIAERELGRHSKNFRNASEQIRNVRNETIHLDLNPERLNMNPEENIKNAYFRWKASQALIEILLLKKMGMTEIPNRTALGIFEVMGEDMLAEQRREELSFDQDPPEEDHSQDL